MRIDCHVHGDAAEYKGDPAPFVAACREAGVERAVLIKPLDVCLAAVEKVGDFLVPVARIDMDDCSSREVAAAIGAGMKGIKFIEPRAPYGDERYWPLYGKIEELGSVAVFHTGYLRSPGREERPIRIEHMRAAQVDVVARRFPDLKILMAHFSNPWWEEGWKVIYTRPNVYADLSGGTALRRATAMWAETFAPDGNVDEVAIRKLVFASDTGYFRGDDPPFGEHLAFYERIFDRMGLSPELREAVNRGTAKALFGLES